MQRILPFLSLFIVTFCACSQDQKAIEQSAVDAKVDSIVGTRMEGITKRAAEDLEKRQAIEVKVKADSILQARAAGAPQQPAPVITPTLAEP